MAIPLQLERVYEVTVAATMQAQACINVFHLDIGKFGALGAEDSLENLVRTIRNIWRTHLLPIQNEDYAVQVYGVKSIVGHTDAAPRHIEYGDAVELPGDDALDRGSIATDALPTFNAVGVQLKTAENKRTARGAKRFAGLTEADTQLNTLTPTAYTSWSTHTEWLMEGTPVLDGDGASMFPGVLSRLLFLGDPNPGANAWARFNRCTLRKVRSLVSSQKSRKQARIAGL